MRSDFMSAVGAYLTLSTVDATGYAAGVRAGGTTLRASSLRVDLGMSPGNPGVARGMFDDRIGIGGNARLLRELLPHFARIDVAILSAGQATTRVQDGRVDAEARATTVGARPRTDLWDFGFSYAAEIFTRRAFALDHVRWGELNGNEAARLQGRNLEFEGATAQMTVRAVNVGVIRTGSGNDTIHAVDTSDIIGGGGSDTIFAVRAGNIHVGDGGSRITGTHVGGINAGDGSDTIVVTQAGHIDAGEGDNKIVANRTGHIDLGDGDDTVVATQTGHIHAGNGRNTIDASGVGNIHLGWGDDTVNATGASHVYGGDGRNVMTVSQSFSVNGGKDADRISASRVHWILAGDGDNIMAVADVGRVQSGNGSDTVAAAGAGVIDTGAGDDTIDATDVRRVIAGAGNDLVTLARATALYRRGDGTDTVRAGADAKVEFAGIRASDVDIAIERDRDGRTVAIDVSLKDGSGGVKILAGPGGAGDAQIRFADGTSVPFALVAARR